MQRARQRELDATKALASRLTEMEKRLQEATASRAGIQLDPAEVADVEQALGYALSTCGEIVRRLLRAEAKGPRKPGDWPAKKSQPAGQVTRKYSCPAKDGACPEKRGARSETR